MIEKLSPFIRYRRSELDKQFIWVIKRIIGFLEYCYHKGHYLQTFVNGVYIDSLNYLHYQPLSQSRLRSRWYTNWYNINLTIQIWTFGRDLLGALHFAVYSAIRLQNVCVERVHDSFYHRVYLVDFTSERMFIRLQGTL